MAKKYIDAEQLKQTVETSMDMQDLYLPSHFFDVIDGMPAADVVERPKEADYTVENALKQKVERRGRWIEIRNVAFPHLLCSECKKPFYGSRSDVWNYCPNCGARMEASE